MRGALGSTSLALALLLGAAACSDLDLPGRPLPADRPLRPADVVDFAALYGANCAGCHGRDGQHGAARALNDPLYLAWADEGVLADAIASGVPGTAMPAFAQSRGGTLTDAQIRAVVAGMKSRWGRADATAGVDLPPYEAPPGDATRGAAAYATYCAGCHGPKGEGGSTPGSIVDPAYLALVSDRALRATVVVGRSDLGMPDWRSDVAGKPMSEAEIADVVAWLVAQRPAPPGSTAPSREEDVDG